MIEYTEMMKDIDKTYDEDLMDKDDTGVMSDLFEHIMNQARELGFDRSYSIEQIYESEELIIDIEPRYTYIYEEIFVTCRELIKYLEKDLTMDK